MRSFTSLLVWKGRMNVSLGTILQIRSSDNVAVALKPIKRGETLAYGSLSVYAQEDIPPGHKIALADIEKDDSIIKYASPIGHAIRDIKQGEWIHVHNMETNLSGKLEYKYQPNAAKHPESVSELPLPMTFEGYLREDGDVGIRNEIWIINTVGCINKVAERLAHMGNKRFHNRRFDGIFNFSHPYGCSQLGDDLLYTQRCLAGLVRHPNAAGVLVIGLGCENNRIDSFAPFIGSIPGQRVKFMSVQAVEDELETGLELLEQLVEYAESFNRTTVPVSKLRIGLKCGGSDGLSGITANPLVGRVSDFLVQQRGTALLTEVPEMFGAETILMNRAKNESVFRDVVKLIDEFKDYYARQGQPIYENPSPGNKDGGITTLEEKSLGCVQKGGTSLVSGVLAYGQGASDTGLQLVQSPGNDMVSVTALTTAGAHMVLFTTGRGTPMGGAVPTVKISTNTSLYEKKKNWIDFNAGNLVTGQDMDSLAASLYRLVVDIASGNKHTLNEVNEFREIAIFKDGVTL